MTLNYNGIDGTNGQYLFPPVEAKELAQTIRGEPPSGSLGLLRDLRDRAVDKAPDALEKFGLPPGADPTDIAQVGWAILFHKDEDAAVKEAFQPLIDHRTSQVDDAKVLKVFANFAGQSCAEWLGESKVSRGAIRPERVPYYILIVGAPDRIPFSFCRELNVEYAVGIVSFVTPAEYEAYVQSVLSYEKTPQARGSKTAVYWGPRHNGDGATNLSAANLITPLSSEKIKDFEPIALIGATATKAALQKTLTASKRTSFLFTASHGMGFPLADPHQALEQGALLCQDWPGFGQIGPDHYFAASDIPEDADLRGLVMFMFACFGAGTPEFDEYSHRPGLTPPRLTGKAFLSALPRALLSHQKGGALACVGHVERAWGFSIGDPAQGTELLVFEYFIRRLLAGEPIAHALRDFAGRYAALSVDLTNTLEQISLHNAPVDPVKLAYTWIARNDAGGFLVVGDPAARLRVRDLA